MRGWGGGGAPRCAACDTIRASTGVMNRSTWANHASRMAASVVAVSTSERSTAPCSRQIATSFAMAVRQVSSNGRSSEKKGLRPSKIQAK
jgi:hypothetical protein